MFDVCVLSLVGLSLFFLLVDVRVLSLVGLSLFFLLVDVRVLSLALLDLPNSTIDVDVPPNGTKPPPPTVAKDATTIGAMAVRSTARTDTHTSVRTGTQWTKGWWTWWHVVDVHVVDVVLTVFCLFSFSFSFVCSCLLLGVRRVCSFVGGSFVVFLVG